MTLAGLARSGPLYRAFHPGLGLHKWARQSVTLAPQPLFLIKI
jgi:hypothetical protein